MATALSGSVMHPGLLPLPEGPDKVGSNQHQIDNDANCKKTDWRLVLLGFDSLRLFDEIRFAVAHWM
jgi:hypothetical protein